MVLLSGHVLCRQRLINSDLDKTQNPDSPFLGEPNLAKGQFRNHWQFPAQEEK